MPTRLRDAISAWLFIAAVLGILLTAVGIFLWLLAGTIIWAQVGVTGLLLFTIAFLLTDILEKL